MTLKDIVNVPFVDKVAVRVRVYDPDIITRTVFVGDFKHLREQMCKDDDWTRRHGDLSISIDVDGNDRLLITLG